MFDKLMKKRSVKTDAEPAFDDVEMTVVRDETPVEVELDTEGEASKRERPKAKVWVKQPNLTVDLDPTVTAMLQSLQSDQEELIKQFEQNLFAIRKIKGGVLTHWQIPTQSLDAVKLIIEHGIGQLNVPQADKLIEK